MSVNHVFSAFSFISFVLVSIPFAWHLEAWNSATCLYMFWVSISNLAFFVNSVVWDGNVGDWAPVWCDISGRLVLATNIAIPATCLCIQRRLYHVILDPVAVINSAQKRRLVIIDMMIGLGLPLLNVALAYIVQGQRYEIVEDFGCHIPVINTSVGVLLVPAWKLSISLISGVYGCINIYHLWVKRRTLRCILGSSTGSINYSRYLRLFMLGGIDVFITIPYNIRAFTTWFPVYPWTSWSAVHVDFSRIDKWPASVWRASLPDVLTYEGTRWISVVYAIIFFVFFGLADEALRHYSDALRTVAKKVGYQPKSSGSSQTRVSERYNLRPTNWMPLHHVNLSESQRPVCEKPYVFGSSESRSSIAPSTNFDADSKHGFDLESRASLNSKKSLSNASQFRIPRIPPPAMSPDLEPTRGVGQPVVSESLNDGIRLNL